VRLRCDGGPVQARGLVGRWRFDEGTGLTVLDSSDSGAHGTLRNMTGSERTAGVLNRALGFDGSNDYVDLPIGPLIGSADSITVATWARFLNTGGSWQRIFDFGTDTNAYMFLSPRTGTSGAMRFAITTGGSAAESVLNSPTTLPTGWHHVAVTIDGPTRAMRLYLDGAVVAGGATAVLPSALGTTTRNYLGRSQYSADGYYSGRLDDFRIYDTVLTSAQVGDLYAVGNLVQHLPLDETWGTTAQDQVGTANGTLVNGPVWTTGTWGGALSLDGANDYVSSFRTVQYHMTLAAWVRTTSAAIGPFGNPSQWWDGEGIVDASRSGNYDDFGCSNNRGKFVFGTGDLGRTEISVLSTSLINDGSWHHVAATRDGSTGQMTVYVDGVPEAARVGYTGQLNSATAMRIGGILDQGRWPDPDPQRLFLGRIDDVRIYGRVLTADQILLLLE